jgi:hypothetical protein
MIFILLRMEYFRAGLRLNLLKFTTMRRRFNQQGKTHED